MGVYSIFVDEDDMVLEPNDYENIMWQMHFDGACLNKVNMEGIIVYSPVGKIYNFSHR
jgi:hypothetical protein